MTMTARVWVALGCVICVWRGTSPSEFSVPLPVVLPGLFLSWVLSPSGIETWDQESRQTGLQTAANSSLTVHSCDQQLLNPPPGMQGPSPPEGPEKRPINPSYPSLLSPRLAPGVPVESPWSPVH